MTESEYAELVFLRKRVAELEADVARLSQPRTRHYQLGTHTARLSLVRSVSS